MAKSRIGLRLTLALALLLFGLPMGATCAPEASGARAGSASEPIWLADGSGAAALLETGTPRSAPEALAIVAFAAAANAGGSWESPAAASGRTPLRVPPRLYLSHCAFLC